jgi:hypothetical protein
MRLLAVAGAGCAALAYSEVVVVCMCVCGGGGGEGGAIAHAPHNSPPGGGTATAYRPPARTAEGHQWSRSSRSVGDWLGSTCYSPHGSGREGGMFRQKAAASEARGWMQRGGGGGGGVGVGVGVGGGGWDWIGWPRAAVVMAGRSTEHPQLTANSYMPARAHERRGCRKLAALKEEDLPQRTTHIHRAGWPSNMV